MDVVEAAVREAKREMAEHLRTAAQEGGVFIERYAHDYMTGQVRRRGVPPQITMHPLLRKLGRELVADVLVYETTRGRR